MIQRARSGSLFLRESVGVREFTSTVPAGLQDLGFSHVGVCCWVSLTPTLSRREREQP